MLKDKSTGKIFFIRQQSHQKITQLVV